MAKTNTRIMRTDPELQKIINQVMANNLRRNNLVKTPRITKAIANQYKKYPDLMKELMDADLR